MSSKAQSKEKFKSKIGGQAVIEGVMMRGIHKAAMACRLPDGTIDLEEGDKRRKRYALVQENAFCEGHFQLSYFSYRRLQVSHKVG